MPKSRKTTPVVLERTCQYPGCLTILSATNKGEFCRPHHTKTVRDFIAEHGYFAESVGVIRGSGAGLRMRRAVK